jgi:hypothetical protein
MAVHYGYNCSTLLETQENRNIKRGGVLMEGIILLYSGTYNCVL